MTIFGKKLSEYVAFQKLVLAIIVVVGLLRLGLSLAGVADSTTKWLSMTVVVLIATIWYGIAVHTKGFGSYRQILPLLVIQGIVSNVIAIAGILIAWATGKPNVFTANEYGGDSPMLLHVGGHVLFGAIVGPLIGWAIASIVMFITKKVTGAPRPVTTATV
jgi:hypothetical protein